MHRFLLGCMAVGILIFALGEIVYALSVDEMRQTVESGKCPFDSSPVTRIDINARCNPQNRETKACDQRFEAATRDWQKCYAAVKACRKPLEEENAEITRYNNFLATNQCKAPPGASNAGSSSHAAPPPKSARSGGSGDLARRLQETKQESKSFEKEYGDTKSAIDNGIQNEKEHKEAANRACQLQEVSCSNTCRPAGSTYASRALNSACRFDCDINAHLCRAKAIGDEGSIKDIHDFVEEIQPERERALKSALEADRRNFENRQRQIEQQLREQQYQEVTPTFSYSYPAYSGARSSRGSNPVRSSPPPPPRPVFTGPARPGCPVGVACTTK